MRFTSLIFFFLIILAVSSCKRECTFICDNALVRVLASGFTPEELDTIEVRKYFANSTFTELVSRTYEYKDLFFSTPVSDRIQIARLDKFYDWEVYIPATGQTHRISAITDEGKTTFSTKECDKYRGCTNDITSYLLDGQSSSGHAVINR